MLMLLSMHVTSVLLLVWFNNFPLTMGFYWSYTLCSSRPFLCALAIYSYITTQISLSSGGCFDN